MPDPRRDHRDRNPLHMPRGGAGIPGRVHSVAPVPGQHRRRIRLADLIADHVGEHTPTNGQPLSGLECNPAKYGGKVRLTTPDYDYSVSDPGKGELWAMHWHPNSEQSKVDYPHIHLRRLFSGDAHLATSRLLVEHAIHWAIEGGATPRYDPETWPAKLQETIRRYLGESSWSVSSRADD